MGMGTQCWALLGSVCSGREERLSRIYSILYYMVVIILGAPPLRTHRKPRPHKTQDGRNSLFR